MSFTEKSPIAQEIQRVGLQGGRTGMQTGAYFDDKHPRVDDEDGPQHAAVGVISGWLAGVVVVVPAACVAHGKILFRVVPTGLVWTL